MADVKEAVQISFALLMPPFNLALLYTHIGLEGFILPVCYMRRPNLEYGIGLMGITKPMRKNRLTVTRLVMLPKRKKKRRTVKSRQRTLP